MKEKMAKKGYMQGDMSPVVEEYQRPSKDYSESDLNRTTEYIERQDKHQGKQSGKVKSQHYQGRYS